MKNGAQLELPCNDSDLAPTCQGEERPAGQGLPARAGLSPVTNDPGSAPGAPISQRDEYDRRRAWYRRWIRARRDLKLRAVRATTSVERTRWNLLVLAAGRRALEAWTRWADLDYEPELVHVDVVLDHHVDGRRYRAKVDLDSPLARDGSIGSLVIIAQYWLERASAWRTVRNATTLKRLVELAIEKRDSERGTVRNTASRSR